MSSKLCEWRVALFKIDEIHEIFISECECEFDLRSTGLGQSNRVFLRTAWGTFVRKYIYILKNAMNSETFAAN